MNGDRIQRDRLGEISRTFYWWNDISVTTGDTDTYWPLGCSRYAAKVVRYCILPFAAFTANASNYWEFTLKVYDIDGNASHHIPGSSFNLDTHPLVVGRMIYVPRVGGLEGRMRPQEMLMCHVHEHAVGTAAAMKARVMVELVMGGR